MGNNSQKTWTEDRKQIVAELLREGLSAGQMSKRLGISRNAIISIIHRDKMLSEIGLRTGVGGARKPRAESLPYKSGRMKTAARHSPARQSQPTPVVVRPTIEPEPVIVSEKLSVANMVVEPFALPLLQLGTRQCRYPVNDAAKGEQHLFCGHWVLVGTSYCKHHYNRVYAPRTKVGAQ